MNKLHKYLNKQLGGDSEAKDSLGRKYVKNVDNTYNLENTKDKYEWNPNIRKFLKVGSNVQVKNAELEIEKYGIPNITKNSAYVKDKSERAFNNVTPEGYGDLESNLKRYDDYQNDRGRQKNMWFDKKTSGTGKDEYYNLPKRDDAFNLYLGLPQKNKSFGISKYRPTLSKEQSNYFKPEYIDDEMKQEYLNNVLSKSKYKNTTKLVTNERNDIFPNKVKRLEKEGVKFESGKTAEWIMDNPLGDFTSSLGKDKEGSYVSMYDKWDLQPFKQGKGASIIDNVKSSAMKTYLKTKGINVNNDTEISELFGAGKPFEVYDRIYYDEKTGKIRDNKQQQGGMNKLHKYIDFRQTGGISRDGTAVSKTRINELERQRINNEYLKSKVDANKTYLNPQLNVSQRVKDLALREQTNERINSRQNKANALGMALSPVPILGEIYNAGNMIAQGVTDAYQGEYTDAALSAIPYGVSKLNKYTKSISKSVFPSNYLSQEEAVIAKGERMLSQKSKFRDQSSEVSEYFRTAKDRHNPASDYPAEKLGVNKSISTEVSKNANLSDANKARIAAHEVGHYYRNSADEANEWSNLVDLKNTGKTGRYLQGKPIFKQEQETEIGNDILNLSKGTRVAEGNYNEIRERAGQLKDYIAQKNNIPLNQDFNITEKQFNNSLKNYVKDTGLDNNMTPFIKSIKDKKGFLNMMNKSALTTTGAIIANDKFKKQQGGSGNLVNAESKEVFRGEDGQIRKVNEQAPTHDEGILINEQGQTQSASYNNGGIVIPAESVLSATHENRDRGDKSYGELDEAIKIKSSELNDYALSLGLKKINHNKTVSPSKAFELLREGRDKEANKLLKFKTNTFSDDYSKASAQANETIANTLVKDEDLYDYLFQIQEIKKTIV